MALPNTPARVVYSDSENEKSFAVGVDGNTYVNNLVFPDGTEQSSSIGLTDASGITITDANGTEVPQTSVDKTPALYPEPPAGTLQFIRRTWFNNAAGAPGAGQNNFVNIYDIPGRGGTVPSVLFDHASLGVFSHSTGGSYHQNIAGYFESVLIGDQTYGNHAGAETSVSAVRANLTDARTGTLSGAGFWVYSGQFEKQTTSTEPSGIHGVFLAHFTNEVGGNQTGGSPAVGFKSVGENFSNPTNYSWYAFYAPAPNTRFPTNNFGVAIGDWGINTGDFNIFSQGVMATSSGKNFFGGPVILSTRTPASTTDAGVTGTVTWDANFIYVCTATNKWGRAALDFNF